MNVPSGPCVINLQCFNRKAPICKRCGKHLSVGNQAYRQKSQQGKPSKYYCKDCAETVGYSMEVT